MEQVLHKLVRQTWCASSVKFFTDIKVIINVIKKNLHATFSFLLLYIFLILIVPEGITFISP